MSRSSQAPTCRPASVSSRSVRAVSPTRMWLTRCGSLAARREPPPATANARWKRRCPERPDLGAIRAIGLEPMSTGFRSDCEGVHRRDFLRVGSAGLLGLTLPQFLSLEARAAWGGAATGAKAKSVIMIWLAGGPATIDMWDNKPNAPEGIRGEFKNIATKVNGVE